MDSVNAAKYGLFTHAAGGMGNASHNELEPSIGRGPRLYLTTRLRLAAKLLVFGLISTFGVDRASAQSGEAPPPIVNAATTVASALPDPPRAGQGTSIGADQEVQLVVALFRHGVRAPLESFGKHAKDSSLEEWPDLEKDWGVAKDGWGDLTPHGRDLAKALGGYYASKYEPPPGSKFKAFLWADIDKRTQDTAYALREGFRPKWDVHVEARPPWLGGADPLFHPFKANCGLPKWSEFQPKLQEIVDDINSNGIFWFANKASEVGQLARALLCKDESQKCKPFFQLSVDALPWNPAKLRESPIEWKGRFSYASSASEAFLLEYANSMPVQNVGWAQVNPPAPGTNSLQDMLQLHEFYFDKTERAPYLAQIQGSNLIREILDQFKRKAGQPLNGECPRADLNSQFVGFVGHDTNLASVGSLLGLQWQFNDPELPEDTRNLPDNDALPAGALVFELRLRKGVYLVRVEYVTYSLKQMRSGSKEDLKKAFRLRVKGVDCGPSDGPCEIPLVNFNERVEGAIDKHFLSSCSQRLQQICIPTSRSRRAIKKPRKHATNSRASSGNHEARSFKAANAIGRHPARRVAAP